MRYLLTLFIFFFASVRYGVSSECEVFFSLVDPVEQKIIDLIDQEKLSIQMSAFCLSHPQITNSLLSAKQRGVTIEIIVDPFSIKKSAAFQRIISSQIPVFVWDFSLKKVLNKTPQKGHIPLMHEKFCIFGNRYVWMGSMNFTKDAFSIHRESALLIDSAPIIQKYKQHFLEMKLYETRSFHEYIALYPKKKKKTSLNP